MHEIQSRHDDQQELLQESLVKSPIVEQIAQGCQVETQGHKNQTLIFPMWSINVKIVNCYTQVPFTRVDVVSVDGLCVT